MARSRDNTDGNNANQLSADQRMEVSRSEKWMAYVRMGIISMVTGAALFGMFWILTSNPIEDVAYARGLITVLISVGVVSMALVLVLSMLLQRRDIDEEEGEKKFQRSKEILSLLLGILGTIVGFYFGTTTTEKSQAVSIVEVLASDTFVFGAEVDLSVFIAGGNAPFAYTITFKNDKDEQIEGLDTIEKETNERWIREKFEVPTESDFNGSKSFTATIEITDSEKTTRSVTRTFTLSNLAGAETSSSGQDEDTSSTEKAAPSLTNAKAPETRQSDQSSKAASGETTKPALPGKKEIDFSELDIDDEEKDFN